MRAALLPVELIELSRRNSNIDQFFSNLVQMEIEKISGEPLGEFFVKRLEELTSEWAINSVFLWLEELEFFCVCFLGRLLETDSKSLRSVNGSRRNSGSSLVSSSSASSNLSHLEEDSWILWGRIVNEWEDVRKKKEKQVKVVVRHWVSWGIFVMWSEWYCFIFLLVLFI